MTSKEIVSVLGANVKRLIEMHKQDAAALTKLQRKTADQADKIRRQQEEIESLKQELGRLQLMVAMGGGEKTRVAHAQLRKLLREVDRCIDLVSKQIK